MMVVIGNRHTTSRSWELSVVQIKPDHTRATCKTERPAMSESNGLQRYNGVEQDDEGAYVYYDEHIAALRRAKAEVLEDLSNLLTYSRFNSYEQRMCERGCGLTKEGRIGASIGLAWALGELDALATLQKGRT